MLLYIQKEREPQKEKDNEKGDLKMNKFDFNVKYDSFKIDSDNVIYGLVDGEWIMLDDSSKDNRVFSIGRMKYYCFYQCSFDCKMYDENGNVIQ